MANAYELSDEVEVIFETPDDHSHFFGYYDKSPFDAGGDRLLSHRVSFDGRRVTAEDTAEVGYWHLDTEEFVKVGETRAFNWQQGSMLQWLPPDYDTRVIYNDLDEDGVHSTIVNVSTGEERELQSPVYAIHPSGEFALTVNFERMALCRPSYSYRGAGKEKWDVPVHEDDGIFRVDLETGERERIISTRGICDFDPKPAFESRDSWLEHMMWNPSGTRFAFFHRWSDGEGGFSTRLFTADPGGSDLFMFPDTGLYSHMDWRNDERFTIWGIKPSGYQEAERFIRENVVLDSIIRPIYGLLRDHVVGSQMDEVLPDRGFLDFHDRTHDFELVAPDLLTHDGHNTWSTEGRWLLTDTYPLNDDIQYLYLYDDLEEELYELGQFPSVHAHSPHKCDLHPRWDRENQMIAIDSAHKRNRQLIVLSQGRT